MESVKKGVQDLTASKKEAMCRNTQLKDELKKIKMQKCDIKQLHAEMSREVEELKRELENKLHAKDKQNGELAAKDKTIQELDEKIQCLNQSNNELEDCIETLKRNLDQNKEKVGDLEQKINSVKKQIAENETEIEDLKEQSKELKECETRLKEEQRNVTNTLNMISDNMKQVENEMETLNGKLHKSEREKKRLEQEVEELEVCLCKTEDKITNEIQQYEVLRKQNEQLAQELTELEEKIAYDQEKLGKYEGDLQKMKIEEEEQVRKLQNCISRAASSGGGSESVIPNHRRPNKGSNTYTRRSASVPKVRSNSSCNLCAPKKQGKSSNNDEDQHHVRFRSMGGNKSGKSRRPACNCIRRQEPSF